MYDLSGLSRFGGVKIICNSNRWTLITGLLFYGISIRNSATVNLWFLMR